MEPYEDPAVVELRRQKQEFLKNEIINKGYEGSYFSDYLNSKKEEGNFVYYLSFTNLQAVTTLTFGPLRNSRSYFLWNKPLYLLLKKAVVDFRRIMDEYRAKGELQENAEDLDGGNQGAGDDSNPGSATLSGYAQSHDDIHVIDVKFAWKINE